MPRRNKNAKAGRKGRWNGQGQRHNKQRDVNKAPMSNFEGHPQRQR